MSESPIPNLDPTADLASRFCQTTVETTEDLESLQEAARRSVKLADFILQESEKLHGVK